MENTQVDQQSNGQNSGEEKNGTKQHYFEKIEGTPFHTVHTEEGWFIVVGNHRMTEPKQTREEAIEDIEKEKWNIIANLTIIIVNRMMNDTKI